MEQGGLIDCMQCEMCGSEIIGKSYRILIEGSELTVCANCLRYGTVLDEEGSKRIFSGMKDKKKGRRSIFDEIVDELVLDYGTKVRKAREEKGWSCEELAKRINERESLIKKVEREDIRPDDALRRKLESVLSIKLTEGIEEANPRRKRVERRLTLGDIVSLKRK
ncbi:MAG TPA: TIGR00270 family protein [Candidatus Syntrophoarchaeum butanivorans]|uniref:TIGR00270 family protein n=1 Tax=Candidatus Syntropharchaeum butanivorans TaxID=1839936 RepID=A0A1F2P5Z2_9EURY|nr:MAG: Conserved hypothetical protein CHP00270 [Candidatus Syntrophoarchaeum butanivorans]HEC56696.1 TIGR00270 family protein [Candidatus Syntrophoarchaeum butanivorans]